MPIAVANEYSIFLIPIRYTYVSNTSYEFNTISYRDTNSNGESAWTYWGAAINDNVNKYIIGSSRNGNEYNGYFFPSDMAKYLMYNP